MRILIFNPEEKGHNFPFLRALIPAIKGLGCDITLALTKQGTDSTEFQAHLAPISGQFQTDGSVAHAPGRRRRIAEMASAVQRNNAEHLLVPNAEPLLAALGVYAAVGYQGIPAGVTSEFTLIRADFAYPPLTLEQRAWFWGKERFINALPEATLSLIDPVAYENIQRRRTCLAARIRLLPELLDNVAPIEKDEARTRLGLPRLGRILGCAGVLDIRKGVDQLIRAFARAELTAGDRLVLAGEATPEVLTLFRTEFGTMVRGGRIILLNRYLTDQELNWVLCASDVVAATYPASHRAPSAIVNKAAVIGRPVLASRFGWSDYMVPEFGLGTLTETGDMKAFTNDIATALAKSGSFVQSPKTARLREYLSPRNFAASWTAGISARLGRPVPEHRKWDWVLGSVAG